jgi:DNA-binding response OmpR family regulator
MEFYQKYNPYISGGSQKYQAKYNKRVLIADDDKTICEAVKLMLMDEGYQVAIITDPEKLYDINSKEIDLILMDVWMQGQDGRDFCRFFKNNSETKNIPIILFSASRDIGWSALKAGADDFMEKPFSMDELLQRISKQIDE